MDPLTQWLHITNKFIKKGESTESTHLMLNGACLDISKDYSTFLTLYSKYVKQYRYYFVEKKTPNFNFFIDLDFIDSEIVNVIKIIKNIQEVILFFYESDYNCIVCSADFKKIIKQGKEYTKQGFHLHWPNLVVNIQIAKQIRDSIVTKLKTLYGKNESSYNSWDDIVDSSVYIKNGLRMCGSYKGHREDGVFKHEGREYWPKFVIKTNGDYDSSEFNKLLDSVEYTIRMCSIRSIENITEIKNTPIGISNCEECETEDNSNSDRKKLSITSNEYKEIIKFFKNHVKDYSVNDIKKIFNYSDGKLFILQTTSQYCQNISRRHNSCGVYFKLSPIGICQKCFCKCDTMDGRKYGYCKDFSSTPIPCSKYLLKLLNWEKISKSNDKKVASNLEKSISVNSFRDLLYNQFTNKSPLREKRKSKQKC